MKLREYVKSMKDLNSRQHLFNWVLRRGSFVYKEHEMGLGRSFWKLFQQGIKPV